MMRKRRVRVLWSAVPGECPWPERQDQDDAPTVTGTPIPVQTWRVYAVPQQPQASEQGTVDQMH